MVFDENYKNLCIAIISQGLEDYYKALIKLSKIETKLTSGTEFAEADLAVLFEQKTYEKSILSDVYNFIHSEWYEMLTDLDGDLLLRGVYEKYKKYIRENRNTKMINIQGEVLWG